MNGTRFFVVRVTKGKSPSGHSVFEALDGRRFVFTPAASRQEADRQAKLAGPGAQVLAVQPRWSLPAQARIAADPEFWKSNPTAQDIAARIGGADAQVGFAGAQGGFIGLDQINLRVPRSLIGRGEVEIALTVEGQNANPVRVNVR